MNIFDALGPVAYAAVATIVMASAFVAMRIYAQSAPNLSEVVVEPNVTGRRNKRERA